LAILSTPTPQQGRFYVAGSPLGEAQRDGLSKAEAGYSIGKGLRGRKVYPHHAGLPDGHWDEPMHDRTQERRDGRAHYQEYRRPQKNRHEQGDDQNRSILGWVKPGAQFTFELNVHNLSAVELGALLWLLKLPDGHFFRFGGGKPLGLGSVRLTIDDVEVRTGQDLLFRYSAWHTLSAPADPSEMAIQSFKEVLRKAYPPPVGEGFESVSFIAAFLAACRGFDDGLPIHYPRAPEDGEPGPPSPDGESFKWFVANERDRKLALPDLAKDKGLPTLEDRS
jgi:CRISPR-associated protein (TIGR03986 family)